MATQPESAMRQNVCALDEVPTGRALCKRLQDGTQVALTRSENGQIAAFENRCPHVDGPLGLGKIKGKSVICPWHFFRFDIETGNAVGLDSVMRLRVFKTAVEGGQVFIEAAEADRRVS
jgi:nitrite reductase (NADH) small subunit